MKVVYILLILKFIYTEGGVYTTIYTYNKNIKKKITKMLFISKSINSTSGMGKKSSQVHIKMLAKISNLIFLKMFKLIQILITIPKN